jgi:hypothetical protein
MSEKVAKKKEKESEQASQQSLEQLVLDKKAGKYSIVPLISYWAKELRKMEEHRHLTQNEILELAMSEVLSGKVSEKELGKKFAEAVPEAPADGVEKPKKKSS